MMLVLLRMHVAAGQAWLASDRNVLAGAVNCGTPDGAAAILSQDPTG